MAGQRILAITKTGLVAYALCLGSAQAALSLLDFEDASEARIKVLADGSQGTAQVTNICATAGQASLWMGPKDGRATAGDFGFAEVHWSDAAKNDWRRFDRLAFDVTNLSASPRHLVFYLYDGTFRKRKDARFSFELPAGRTRQIVASLDWAKLGVNAADIRALTLVHSSPGVGAIAVDRVVLLAPNEAVPPAVEAKAFASEISAFQAVERVCEAAAMAEQDERERRRAAEFKRRLEAPRTEQRAALGRFTRQLAAAGQDVSGLVVAQASAMQQIRPRDTDFAALAPAKGIALRLARDAYEDALLAVAVPGEKPLRNVALTVEGEVAQVLKVEVQAVGYVLADVPTRHGLAYCEPSAAHACGYVRKVRETPLGWYADPILPFLDKVDVQPGDVQSFLVRVKAPADCAARTYTGQVRVSAAEVADFCVPLTVRVNGFSVGKASELPLLVTFTPFVQPLSLSWTKEQAEALRRDAEAPVNLWRRQRERWCTTLGEYFLLPTTIYPARGDVIPDFDLIQQAAREGRKGSFIVAPWSLCSDEAYWRQTFLEPLKKRYAAACAAGLGEYAMTYGCDETQPEHFPKVKRALDILKREVPQIPVITTAGDAGLGVASELAGADAFCPHVSRWDAAKVAAARAAGHKVWWYVACPDMAPYANFFVESPLSEGRLLMGAQAVREKPDGFLYYAIAKWNQQRPITSGPFTDWSPHGIRHRCQPAYDGDGVWIYCGPDGIPVPTLRLENFRDGVEDFNYAKILERLYARHVDKADAWAKEAKQLLDVPLSVMESLSNFTDSPAAIYAWRDRMADLIEVELAK
ncbi:MAG: DUF4091 domain-containing protein [Kiritimatiellae bacterium]|nr:DUF4091 domain-containing protein [Kiritimatiellia bacterium]